MNNEDPPQEHKFAKLKEIGDSETPLRLEYNKKRLREEPVRERREGNGNMVESPQSF